MIGSGDFENMKIGLLAPDSKRPNLALMKISAYEKERGNEVFLNFPLQKVGYTYASLLYSWTLDPIANLIGGSKYPEICLPPEIDKCFPDYSLYPQIDYSLGYTYKACPRKCWFCIVPKQLQDKNHYSIWTFHNPKFKKICLLNNNTLADPRWRETFQEIWDADLKIRDENGYDLRLITEESANYISKTKFETYIHCAWDLPKDEEKILSGINFLLKAKAKKLMCYVLIGHTTHKENLYRVLSLKALKILPFVMPLNKFDFYQRRFARWINRRYYEFIRWEDYDKAEKQIKPLIAQEILL